MFLKGVKKQVYWAGGVDAFEHLFGNRKACRSLPSFSVAQKVMHKYDAQKVNTIRSTN